MTPPRGLGTLPRLVGLLDFALRASTCRVSIRDVGGAKLRGQLSAAPKRPDPLPAPRLKLFKRLSPLLIGATVFSAAVALIWPDLGLNLVADAAALWFVLFVVDVAVERGQSDHGAPVRLAADRSVLRLHDRLIAFTNWCLDDCWTIKDAADLKAAFEDQDARYLAPVLTNLVFDRHEDDDDKVRPNGGGRIAEEAFLLPALREADRFMQRYNAVADPQLIELMERLETCGVVTMLAPKLFPLRRLHVLTWAEFLGIVHALQEWIRAAEEAGELSGNGPLPQIAPRTEEWLRMKPGWTEVARRIVEVPRTPRGEFPRPTWLET